MPHYKDPDNLKNSGGIFLGEYSHTECGVTQDFDLYWHPSTIIARFGNDDTDYLSGFACADVDPILAEAKRRALAKCLDCGQPTWKDFVEALGTSKLVQMNGQKFLVKGIHEQKRGFGFIIRMISVATGECRTIKRQFN